MQEKSYGISQRLLIVATVFCDCLSLPSFSSSCFTNMCEYIQPSKWRLQKKGKPVRDPSYCSLSPSNLEKLYVVSTPEGQGAVMLCSLEVPVLHFTVCVCVHGGVRGCYVGSPAPCAIKCSPHFAARKVFVHLPTKDVRAVRFWSGLGHSWLQSSTGSRTPTRRF